jgi:hypothetical protein
MSAKSTKTKGILVTVTFLLPLDKGNFAKVAATYNEVAEIDRSKKLPDDFLTRATLVTIATKEGAVELPTAGGDKNDPASWPLTTDALPEGATVIEASTMLDGNIFQTIKLADDKETFRRISAEQDAEERKKDKKRPVNKAAPAA